MSQTESIGCPICLRQFNSQKRLPKLIPICSHTVCKDCLSQALQKESPKCPLDNKSIFAKDPLNIDAFPTNFLGKDLLEMKGIWDQCEIHNEEKKMICMKDDTLVCHRCVIFGEHKGHQVKLLSDFQDDISAKKSELGAISNKLSKGLAGLHPSLAEWECSLRPLIQAKFQKWHLILIRKEGEILSRVNEFTFHQRISIESALNLLSDLSSEIENKLNELDDITLNPNITKVLAQDFTADILKPLDEKLDSLNSKLLKETSEFTAIFDKIVLNDNQLEELSEPLNQHLLNKFPDALQEQFTDGDVQVSDIELNIIKDIVNSKISVQPSPTKRSYTFTKQEVAQIREIHYQFQLEDQNMNYTSLYARYILPKIFTNVTSIFVNITNLDPRFQGIDSSGYFHFLFFVIFSHPQNLQHIHIEANQLGIRDLGPTFIVERVLPQAKNLKSLTFILPHCAIGTLFFRALINADLAKLESFKLFLAGVICTEEDVTQLLNKIPNAKDLVIAIGDTSIRNQTLEHFSTHTLPTLNKLENFEVGFWNTLVTDEAIHKFLMNLPPSIKNLMVGFEGTNTTDAALLEFLDAKIPLLPNLQEMTFHSSRTQISNEISERIQQIK